MRCSVFTAVFAAIALSGPVISGQATPARRLAIVHADTAIPGLPAGRPIFEPNLAANPVRAGHLFGAAIVAEAATPFSPAQNCVGVVTFDGGRSWQSHVFDVQACGDPWVAIGADGTAWFAALGKRGDSTVHRMYIYRSADGGRTWKDAPHDFGPGHDHQTLIAARDAIYVVSALGRRTEFSTFHAFMARSIDGGASWSTLTASPSNLNTNTLAGGMLPDGSLLIPFIDGQRPGSSGMLARRRAWVYRAKPDLSQLSPPLMVSEDCGSNSGFGSLVVDPGSPRAIFTCVNASQHVIVHGSDGGLIWSDPLVVEAQSGIAQRVPAGAALAGGAMALSWMDSRGGPAECFVLRAALSEDGGRSFQPSIPVSTATSCPQAEGNGQAGKRWRNTGDYSGFAAGAGGSLHALWADSRSGVSQLRFATLGAIRP